MTHYYYYYYYCCCCNIIPSEIPTWRTFNFLV